MPPPPNITTHLATDDDAPILAHIMTAAFSASDKIYPLIWGGAKEGTHDMVSQIGLFTPVQKENRITYKAVDSNTVNEKGEGKVVGFVTWTLPKEGDVGSEGKEERGLPEIDGVNTALWMEKINGMSVFSKRDMDTQHDMNLTFLFILPSHQRQGIASLLLKWGIREAESRKARIWCSSTPQAISTYERNGWKVVERYEIELGRYGGEGGYCRAWMVREVGR